MNLVIDIGNTQSKVAVFDGRELVYTQVCEDLPVSLEPLVNRYPVKNSILSNVRHTHTLLNNYLSVKTALFIELDYLTPLPFRNLYRTKKTLGRDRLAAAAGAAELFPDADVLVIDMGTAITIDLITSQNQFLGGNISPGMHMRFLALHQQTAALPLLKPGDTHELIGRSTPEAIRAGVINGIIFEVTEYKNRLSQRYPDLKVVLTGGDAHYFAEKLKKPIFVDLNLTLKGLNRILDHNEQLLR